MIQLVKTNIPPREILMPELEKVLYSGYVAQGEKVEEFERAFESFIGKGFSLSVNSGTAPGALVREAEYGQSKPDFISKMSIALKEANECDFWTSLLRDSDFISQATASTY